MKRKRFIHPLFSIVLVALVLYTCKDSGTSPQGTLNLGITDTRSSTQKTGGGIIDASKLTKFEITISKIELKTSSGTKINAFDKETTIDLRSYQGIVKDLGSVNIPLGKFTGVIIHLSGASLTYNGNTYASSVNGTTSLSLGALPGTVFTTAQGVPNIFTSDLGIELNFDFELTDSLNRRNLNLGLDAVASCYEIEFACPLCAQSTQHFIGFRPFFQMSVFFNEGIQQVKYSPPLGIKLLSGSVAEYYGLHTFVDFNGIGGTINSHTSQHVYRGEDGSLMVDAEDMKANTTALTPNIISATGKTDVKAFEVFNFSTIGTNLAGKGYTLTSGKTYYFSFRKTWKISTGNTSYQITRMCEPIPVYWP